MRWVLPPSRRRARARARATTPPSPLARAETLALTRALTRARASLARAVAGNALGVALRWLLFYGPLWLAISFNTAVYLLTVRADPPPALARLAPRGCEAEALARAPSSPPLPHSSRASRRAQVRTLNRLAALTRDEEEKRLRRIIHRLRYSARALSSLALGPPPLSGLGEDAELLHPASALARPQVLPAHPRARLDGRDRQPRHQHDDRRRAVLARLAAHVYTYIYTRARAFSRRRGRRG